MPENYEKTCNEYVQPESEIIPSQGKVDHCGYDKEGELQGVTKKPLN